MQAPATEEEARTARRKVGRLAFAAAGAAVVVVVAIVGARPMASNLAGSGASSSPLRLAAPSPATSATPGPSPTAGVDPALGSWEGTESMVQTREGATLTLLESGDVLLVGGYPYGQEPTSAVDRYEVP